MGGGGEGKGVRRGGGGVGGPRPRPQVRCNLGRAIIPHAIGGLVKKHGKS